MGELFDFIVVEVVGKDVTMLGVIESKYLFFSVISTKILPKSIPRPSMSSSTSLKKINSLGITIDHL